jgi:hypothetical protein
MIPTRKELIEKALSQANAKAIQNQWKAHRLRKSVDKTIKERNSARKIRDTYKRWSLRNASHGKTLKQHVLKKLRDECLEMSDPVSLESFYDLTIDDLMHIHRIGDDIHGKKRCYKYSTLKDIHDKHGWKDPLTRQKWDEDDWERIERRYSYSNHLVEAARNGDLDTIKFLVRLHGKHIVNDFTVLARACSKGNATIVKYLTSIMNQEVINSQSPDGWTALHWAVFEPNGDEEELLDIVKHLLIVMSPGAINAHDTDGATALHLVVGNGPDDVNVELKIVKLLTTAMSKEAILKRDINGETALDYATELSKMYLKKVFQRLQRE